MKAEELIEKWQKYLTDAMAKIFSKLRCNYLLPRTVQRHLSCGVSPAINSTSSFPVSL